MSRTSNETAPVVLRRLWLALAIGQALFAFSVLSRTQGSSLNIAFGNIGVALPEDMSRPVAAYWGVIVLTFLIWASSWLVLKHAEGIGGTWRHRFALRVKGVPPDSQIGRIFAMIGVVVFLVMPLWTWAHSWRVIHKHGVLCDRLLPAGSEEVATGWSVPWTLGPEGVARHPGLPE